MAYVVKPTTELIGAAFLENVLEEGALLSKSHSMALLSYDYKVVYSRDNTGTPYGAPTCIEAKFVVDAVNRRELKTLYQRLNSYSPDTISFIFNCTFDQNTELLVNFDSGLVARCYVVDLEEFYDVEATKKATSPADQMSVAVKVLLTKITYIGSNDRRLALHISE